MNKNIFYLNTDLHDICSIIEQEKSPLKIVTKTRNEIFFIEKWIQHHINIIEDTKLIIFDNMSDDEYVSSIYERYKNNIILIKFDWYMDCIHMVSWSKWLYRSLSVSSKFFTILDSDEYLYFYDDNKLINDNSIVHFIEENTNCNFFTPLYVNCTENNENILFFNHLDVSSLHLSKPIVSSKIIPIFELALKKYECPTLHHTKDLPLSTYGIAPIRFVIVHLKNMNKYQRINTNMLKLVSLSIIKHDRDFSTLFTIDPNTITSSHSRNYVTETKKIIEDIQNTDRNDNNPDHTITLLDDRSLEFAPASLEEEFKKLIYSDYFDLMQFDPHTVDMDRYTTINSYRKEIAASKG